jgi:TonB family protein
MTFRLGTDDRAFKRAMVFSAAVHSILLALIIVNPSLPNPRKSGPVYYINFGGSPGGGNGGGGRGGVTIAPPAESTVIAPTEVKPQTLRDLTTVQKLQMNQPSSALRFPVDKPKREAKPAAAKKTEISKVDPSTKAPAAKTDAAGTQGAGGAGLLIGAGKPGFGEGAGSGLGGLSDQIGNSDFPYTYYSTAVREKISSNWFESLVDPGVGGTFQVAVYFRIFKDGSISSVDIKETSGIKTLDQSAVRAILRSANFPPLPDGYNEPYLGIVLIFEYTK